MVDFRFLYEHKAREMESIALISYELKKRGYSCDFFPCNGMGGMPKETAKVIITPYLYQNVHLEAMSRYTKGSNKIVNLQWEQVFPIKDENDSDYEHYPHGVTKTAMHLCWGEREKQALLRCGVKEQNAVVTGPVHMDFLRKEFKGYYDNRDHISKRFNLNAEKEWVLFISSFSGEARKIDRNGNMIDENNYDKSKTIFLSWIEELLKIRTNILFVYRPHPNEKSDLRLLDLSHRYSNFKLIRECSVKQWILVCDKIINWISTSIAEIYFANKNCIIVRPIEIEKEKDMATLADAKKETSCEEFLKSFNYSETFPVDPQLIKNYYDVEIEASYKRICNVLEKVYKENELIVNKNVIIKYPIILRIKKLFSRTPFYKAYIYAMAKIPEKISSYFPYKIRVLIENSKMRNRDFITEREIEDLYKKLKGLLI